MQSEIRSTAKDVRSDLRDALDALTKDVDQHVLADGHIGGVQKLAEHTVRFAEIETQFRKDRELADLRFLVLSDRLHRLEDGHTTPISAEAKARLEDLKQEILEMRTVCCRLGKVTPP